jgi:cardiolipin synthase
LSRPVGATLVVVLVIVNLSSGEKNIEHKIERLYPRDDPQFLRSMGLPLGPTVVGRNRFDLLMNGEPIFPSMMEGIHSARRTISLETSFTGIGGIGEQIASALPDIEDGQALFAHAARKDRASRCWIRPL